MVSRTYIFCSFASFIVLFLSNFIASKGNDSIYLPVQCIYSDVW